MSLPLIRPLSPFISCLTFESVSAYSVVVKILSSFVPNCPGSRNAWSLVLSRLPKNPPGFWAAVLPKNPPGFWAALLPNDPAGRQKKLAKKKIKISALHVKSQNSFYAILCYSVYTYFREFGFSGSFISGTAQNS